MLCSVVCITPFNCCNIVCTQLLFIFALNFIRVKAALPPGAEDEIVLIEHLPGRRVHLQDFFWTGAEDAPPWLDPDQMLTFYETRTVHHTATVYVPGEDPNKGGDGRGRHDPGCTSCIDPTPTLIDPDQGIGILIGNDPGPRYWLLTVLRAGEIVPSKVELRLARLYRAAFSRQQQRHLGLLSKDPRLRRAAHKKGPLDQLKSFTGETADNNIKNTWRNFATTNNSPIMAASTPTPNFSPSNETVVVKKMREIKIPEEDLILRINLNTQLESTAKKREMNATAENTTISSVPLISETLPINTSINNRIVESPQALRSYAEQFYPDLTEDNYIKPSSDNDKDSNTGNRVAITFNQTESNLPSVNKDINTNETAKITDLNLPGSRLSTKGIEIVQVRMQNTTVLEDGSTRLIYSVHLGGKPVPAETAAKDMALLSPQEVALELGAPVVIQSEPYLKETRPLALSRTRDAWLLIGTAATAVIFLVLIIVGLIITAKKKRAYSAVSAPPAQSILKKDKNYAASTPGLDNTGYTSETEGRTDGTSQRQTPPSNCRTPGTPITPNTLDDDIQELSTDNEQDIKPRVHETWDIEKYPETKQKSRSGKKKLMKVSAIERSESSDSMETVVNCDHERRESIETGNIHPLEDTASPNSYLSMPSCKLFPSMRSVEPLSRILEPSVVKNLDIDFETPEMTRRTNGYSHKKFKEDTFGRTRSAVKDPGVVGPIVWDLRKHRAVEDTPEVDLERQLQSSGPVGRARRRLHELLEDSFTLFGAKDIRIKDTNVVSSSLHPPLAAISPDRVTICSEWKEKSNNASPDGSPNDYPKARPRTSLPRDATEEPIPETGNTSLPPRGAWGSRPMSAGPFHRPNLPEVNVPRMPADSHLALDDPAVPLIAAIRKELEKFTPTERT